MVTPLAHIRCGQEDTVAAESADEDAAPALADAGRTGLPACRAVCICSGSARIIPRQDPLRDPPSMPPRRLGPRLFVPARRAVLPPARWLLTWRVRILRAGRRVGVVRGPWGAVLHYCSAGAGGTPPARRGAAPTAKQTTRFLTKLPRCGSCQRVPALLVLCRAV